MITTSSAGPSLEVAPAFRARIWQLGSEVVTSKTPAEFQALYVGELKRWDALVKAAGIKVE